MKKLYKSLTKSQKNDGIIFTSSLSENKLDGDIVHTVHENDNDKDVKIERLLDDSFFNNSPYKFNIIRRI